MPEKASIKSNIAIATIIWMAQLHLRLLHFPLNQVRSDLRLHLLPCNCSYWGHLWLPRSMRNTLQSFCFLMSQLHLILLTAPLSETHSPLASFFPVLHYWTFFLSFLSLAFLLAHLIVLHFFWFYSWPLLTLCATHTFSLWPRVCLCFQLPSLSFKVPDLYF